MPPRWALLCALSALLAERVQNAPADEKRAKQRKVDRGKAKSAGASDTSSGGSRELVSCPQNQRGGLESERGGGQPVVVSFRNKASVRLSVFWVRADRSLVFQRGLSPGGKVDISSTVGSAFRLFAGSFLFMEYKVGAEETAPEAEVQDCPGYRDRSKEFEGLSLSPDEPCAPMGHSGKWTCIQNIPKSECDRRVGPDYGFLEGETQSYKAGDVEDFKFDAQIRSIPSMATGYLRMNMTDAMRKALLPAFATHGRNHTRRATAVPGGFLNDAKVSMDMAPMGGGDVIRREMTEILSWWTGLPLTSTSVFGIRVYRRGNVLVNHVDRKDTHIISAVLQVGQIVDDDGGWPLEVRTEARDCVEVYLQPGQMVLYEGGRLKHGRPMRFRGDEFANVFVHFMPQDWKWPPPQHYKDKERNPMSMTGILEL